MDHHASGRARKSAREKELSDADAIERGRRFFAQACDFVAGAAVEDALPAPELPEIAFAGRSNVGKSSLLNALVGHRRLARVSMTPGRTQQLNFFRLAGTLMLVDLPGYGHAAAAKRQIRSWTGLIHAYLRGRPNLRRVLVLVDSRHGLKPNDHALMAELDDVAVSYQIVLTKADKAGDAFVTTSLASVEAAIAKRPAAHPEVAVTSAETGVGIPELRAGIAALAGDGGFR